MRKPFSANAAGTQSTSASRLLMMLYQSGLTPAYPFLTRMPPTAQSSAAPRASGNQTMPPNLEPSRQACQEKCLRLSSYSHNE